MLKRTGLGASEYYDLETSKDELVLGISVSQASSVLRVLQLDPTRIFPSPNPANAFRTDIRSFSALTRAIADFIVLHRMTVGSFEDIAGWEVADKLEKPGRIGDLNLDGLRDICTTIGVDWRFVVHGEEASTIKPMGEASSEK